MRGNSLEEIQTLYHVKRNRSFVLFSFYGLLHLSIVWVMGCSNLISRRAYHHEIYIII